MKISTISKYLMAFILALGFTACADEDIVESNGLVVEGVPVKVQIPISIPKMEVMESRVLSDEQERTMTDLYVIVFDKDKNREASYYFKPDANNAWVLSESKEDLDATIQHNHDTNTEGKTEGTLKLAMTSGQKYIYGFANVDNNALTVPYKDKLDAVTNVEALKNVIVSFQSETSTAAVEDYAMLPTKPAIPMSGHFYDIESNTPNEDGSCIIAPDGTVSTKGKIYLKRLFAKIKFIITKGGNVEKFTLNSWQAYHLPQYSMLVPDATNDADDHATLKEAQALALFKDTYPGKNDPYVEDVDANNDIYGFEYYMLENRKQLQHGPLTDYKKRETPGDNDLEYYYVEPNATYILLKGTLEMTMGENAVTDLQDGETTYSNVKRYADVEYIIHLGGEDKTQAEGTPDADNFEVLRNTSYTYEITVNGVEDIRVKVTDDTENDTSANGEIVDITGGKAKFDLDCHNHVFTIKLKNIPDKPFLFRMITPQGELDNIATDADGSIIANNDLTDGTYKDGHNKNASLLTWIQFRATEDWDGKEQFALYNPKATWKDGDMPKDPKISINAHNNVDRPNYVDANGGDATEERGITPLMNLYELAKYVDRLPEDKEQMFTVFVKEYYYEKDPDKKTPSDDDNEDWGLNKWHLFVNKDNRSVVLDLYSKQSDDHKSAYSQGDIYITQKSIQTFYKDGIAIGVEHENETGFPIWKDWDGNTDPLMAKNYWYHKKELYDDKNEDWKISVEHMRYPENGGSYQRVEGKYLTEDNGYYNQYMALIYLNNEDHTANWSDFIYRHSPINEYPKDANYIERWGYTEFTATLSRIPYEKEAIVDCLNRNRDENGNGKLEMEEMKWYLPASKQMYEIYMGAETLTTPLFNRSEVSQPKYDGQQYLNLLYDGAYTIGGNPNPNDIMDGDANLGDIYLTTGVEAYHYLTSDIRTFWAEEGCSTGETKNVDKTHRNFRIRCVRTLGTPYPTTEMKKNDVAAYYFSDSDEEQKKAPKLYDFDATTNTFTFDRLDDGNFRTYVDQGELTSIDNTRYDGAHVNFGNQNLLYKGFVMASDFVTRYKDKNGNKDTQGKYYKKGNEYAIYHIGGLGNTTDGIVPYEMQGWTPCTDYHEERDNGKSWRMPNQREMAIMYSESIDYVARDSKPGDGNTWLDQGIYSCTAWDFYSRRMFGFRADSDRKYQMYMMGSYGETYGFDNGLIRCVRDKE